MSIATPTTVLTADEYFALPDDGRHKELVRGRIVAMNMPGFEHGEVCLTIGSLVREFVTRHALGRVVGNDAGILTDRDPDTVRGADVAYYSYRRLPKNKRPKRYAGTAPELVFEVLSPDDRWPRVLRKVSEYLEAGVVVVGVADPTARTLHVYRAHCPGVELRENEFLTLPDVLPKFRIRVKRFFDE